MVELLSPPTVESAIQGAPAGLVSRTLAAVIDAFVIVLALTAGYLGVSAAKFLFHPRHFSFPVPSSSVMVTIGGVLAGLYLTVCWAASGRTYGDLILGLRVVRRGGRHLNPLVALARAFAYLVLPVGLLVAGVDRRRRSLQDMVFRSSVVYDWSDV